jgi:predicted dehydrogenase
MDLSSEFEVAALAEPAEGLRAKLSSEYSFERTYESGEELLDHPGLNAVLICSPNATHAQLALSAAERDMSVLIEKPLCIAPEDAARIYEATNRGGLSSSVGYMKRLDDCYKALLSSLDSTDGRLLAVNVCSYEPEDPASTNLRAAQDGPLAAALMEQVERAVGNVNWDEAMCFCEIYLGSLIHDLNLVRGVLSELDDEVDDGAPMSSATWSGGFAVTASLRTQRDAHCNFMWVQGGQSCRETLVFIFEHAVHELVFSRPYFEPPQTKYTRRAHGQVETMESPSESDPFRDDLLQFYGSMKGQTAPSNTVFDAKRDIEILTGLFLAQARTEPTD